ncbi:MAG: molybdopterin molybdotransferase MoeA [Steroidobacteraceae bacterium]|jgi:molybdopterin molybdotransferase|nr:molybdopterin molybdotransferase MoeA [Steroidobacteraceae bacterium]
MLTPAEAAAAIAAHVTLLPAEQVPLARCGGRVLRQPVRAERDAPPFDRVAMDGIALRHATLAAGSRRFPVAGTQAAGHPPLALPDPHACLEVMTGAVLPSGCDVVVPVEDVFREGPEAVLPPALRCEPWQHVHRRASDARAGDLLLAAGTGLRAPEIAIVASAGLAAVEVTRQPRVAVISTGDELVDPGAPILDHQVRRSNAYALATALTRRGGAQVEDAHVRDDEDAIAAAIAEALERNDFLVLSGGVSMGRFDHVPRVLGRLGVREIFHRVAQRPGKPMWFGVAPLGQPVFGLPGNPVSVLACLLRYVLPALEHAQGLPPTPVRRVALAEAVTFRPALAWLLPVELECDAEGRSWALPRPTHGSGDFNALAGTSGFIELPPGPVQLAAGATAPFHSW